MNKDEADYIMISALQHFMFCTRQCALIHIEQLWQENYFTTSGVVFHEKAHTAGNESRKSLHIARDLKIASSRYGISGKNDVVEFVHVDYKTDFSIKLPGVRGYWSVFPVEYKRGRTKEEPWDEVQLCAQALCLEEMLHVIIEKGALFYGAERRRKIVYFDSTLRALTIATIEKTSALISIGETPPPIINKRCKSCSLNEYCFPLQNHIGQIEYESALFEE